MAKRTTKQGQDESGPTPKAVNKQRVTMLSRKEKAATAAMSGGWSNDIIPRAEVVKLLTQFVTDGIDAAALADVLTHRMGWYRMQVNAAAARLTRQECIDQATHTAAVAHELLERLSNLYPDVEAVADHVIYKARGEFVHAIKERIKPDLYLLQVAMERTAAEISEWPTKTGPKVNPSHILLAEIFNAIRKQAPAIGVTRARRLAAEMLGVCGVAAPDGDKELREAIGGYSLTGGAR